MKLLDLFSGIGGFSLGLERAGFKTVAFCEIEDYPRRVLAKHWPDVPIAGDIRKLSYNRETQELIYDGQAIYRGTIDAICGGFPCQDISVAGNQKGIAAERSGLWSELHRLISEIQPRYAIVENVTALLSGDSGRWFQRVLGDLAEIGFDAEWHCISASELGAHHHRDRVWIICYPEYAGRIAAEVGEGNQARNGSDSQGEKSTSEPSRPGNAENVANVESEQRNGCKSHRENCESQAQQLGSSRVENFTHSNREGLQGGAKPRIFRKGRAGWIELITRCFRGFTDISAIEPVICGSPNGISRRVDRLKGLGNAVVPQIPELLGRAIMKYEEEK